MPSAASELNDPSLRSPDGETQDQLGLVVRVGCALIYEASHPATVLLNVRPSLNDERQFVQAERLRLGEDLPAEEFPDAHGNIVTRVILRPGRNEIRHDALVAVSAAPDNYFMRHSRAIQPRLIPPGLLRYTLPSRYCESDKLMNFAWQKFGAIEDGRTRVQAICDWVHANIEYRFGSGQPDLSACDIINRGFGVCRDYAHVGVALCRTFNLPTRYVTGHLPDIGCIDPGSPMDFHAYFEVFLDGAWLTFDPRYNVPRIGRIKISSGFDAIDGAFGTTYGGVVLSRFDVWAYQVAPGTVALGDPIDLAKRIDGATEVRRQ